MLMMVFCCISTVNSSISIGKAERAAEENNPGFFETKSISLMRVTAQ
jgi:hypothetical protein